MSVKNKTLFSSRNFTAEHVKFTKKTTTFFSFFELSEEPFFRIVLIKSLYLSEATFKHSTVATSKSFYFT